MPSILPWEAPSCAPWRRPTWSVAVAAVLVALLATGSIAALDAHADAHYEARADLARAVGMIQRTKGIQEQTEADHEVTPGLVAEHRELLAATVPFLDRLAAAEGRDPLRLLERDAHVEPAEIRTAYDRYAAGGAEVLRLFGAGRVAEAERWDEEHADPAYDQLLAASAAYDEHLGETALLADRLMLLGTGAALLAAALLVGLLFHRFERSRRAVALAAVEREVLRRSEGRFRALVQHSTDIIAVLEADGAIRYASPAIAATLGHRPGDLLGADALALIHPDDREAVAGAFARRVAGRGLGDPRTFRMRHADGSWRHLEAVGNNLRDDPAVRGVVVNARDITARRRAEEGLRRSEALLVEAQRLAHLGIFRRDLATGETVFSDELYRIHGFAPGQVDLGATGLLALVHPADAARVRAWMDGVLAGRRDSIDHRIVRPSGEVRWVQQQVAPTLDAAGRLRGLTGILLDVTERKALEERLAHQATHDPLTGLPNRTLFLDRLGQALARAGRDGAGVGVLFLDLDGFKVVNDSLGHAAGDELLVAFGRRLPGCCLRPGDTLARFGGDEFAVLLEGVRDPGEAARVAERIATCPALQAPYPVAGREVRAGASIGGSWAGPGRRTPLRCCGTPTPRSTAPRRRARAATRSSTRR